MKKSLRPKMRPARLEKMMPGDELSTSETTIEATRPKARPEKMMPGDELPSNRVMTTETQKYAEGGKVRGWKGGRGDRKKDPASDKPAVGRMPLRDPEEYAGGGMVRGCKSAQMSGKGFRGSY